MDTLLAPQYHKQQISVALWFLFSLLLRQWGCLYLHKSIYTRPPWLSDCAAQQCLQDDGSECNITCLLLFCVFLLMISLIMEAPGFILKASSYPRCNPTNRNMHITAVSSQNSSPYLVSIWMLTFDWPPGSVHSGLSAPPPPAGVSPPQAGPALPGGDAAHWGGWAPAGVLPSPSAAADSHDPDRPRHVPTSFHCPTWPAGAECWTPWKEDDGYSEDMQICLILKRNVVIYHGFSRLLTVPALHISAAGICRA